MLSRLFFIIIIIYQVPNPNQPNPNVPNVPPPAGPNPNGPIFIPAPQGGPNQFNVHPAVDQTATYEAAVNLLNALARMAPSSSKQDDDRFSIIDNNRFH